MNIRHPDSGYDHLIIFLCFVRPPDLEVDQDTRDDPRDHDRSPDCPETKRVIDQNVSREVWALPEGLRTFALDRDHDHKGCYDQRVYDEVNNVVAKEVFHSFLRF